MPVIYSLLDIAEIRSLAWVDHPLVHTAIHWCRWILLPLGVLSRTLHLLSIACYIPPNVPRRLPHNPSVPLLEPGSDLGKGWTCDRRGADSELSDARDRGCSRRQVARAQ